MKALKIALTGGPGGGKTSSIDKIVQGCMERGYQTIVVPEAATILINMGIKPFGENAIDMVEFQRFVMDLQIKLENYADYVSSQTIKPCVVLCDRGLLDDRAYVSEDEYLKLLREFNLSMMECMSRYQLVIHMVTPAFGKEEFYTLENNRARSESVEEARNRDRKTLQAWLGHDNLKVIGNESDFDAKLDRCLNEVYAMLNKPSLIQRQEKYLVQSFDLDKLRNLSPVKLDITQYVEQIDGGDVLYRMTKMGDEIRYSKTVKLDTGVSCERFIRREDITKKNYLNSIPSNKLPIQKTRFAFEYLEQYYRLDVFDKDFAILEIEDTNRARKRVIPDFISVCSNITDDEEYRNSKLYEKINSLDKILYKKGRI